MIAQGKYLIPVLVAVSLALTVQGHAADQPKSKSDLRNLTAATTHAKQPSKGQGSGH